MPTGLLFAQLVAGKSQPDRIDFGRVRIDAVVEGSILVFTDADESTELACDVQAPPFVKITSVQRGIATDRRGATKSTFYVYVAVNTQRIGEYEGAIAIDVGSQKTTIPAKVSILASDATATRVLIVSTPFNCSSAGESTALDPWLRLVEAAKLDPHYLEVVRNQPLLRELDLSRYDVILLGEYGLLRLLDADLAKLKRFVNNGGRLLICANHFFRGTVDMANRLLNSAGLRMTDTEPDVNNNSFALSGNDIVESPLTKSVRTMKFIRPSPIAVTDKSKGKILVHAPPYPGEGFLAAGQDGTGQIFVLGQSLWWSWIGEARYNKSDNRQLLLNLVTKASK